MLTSRTLFTWKQKAELWERRKNGQSVLAISRGLERRNKTGVQRIVVHEGNGRPSAPAGGPMRARARSLLLGGGWSRLAAIRLTRRWLRPRG